MVRQIPYVAWFSRARQSRFPADMLRRLELLGRFEFDPSGCGIDGGQVAKESVVPFYQDSQDNREAFLTDLQAVVAADGSGFATYGAARLVWEMYGDKGLRIPEALPLIDGGIEFKRSRGMATRMHLTGYEQQRLRERGDQVS